MAEETEWTIDDLGTDCVNDGYAPTAANTIALVNEYRNSWVKEEGLACDMSTLCEWVMTRLSMDAGTFDWQEFQTKYNMERTKLMNLRRFIELHKLDGETKEKFYQASSVLYSLAAMFKQCTRMLVNIHPGNMTARTWILPEHFNTMDTENSNMFDYEEKSTTNFQRVFLHLLQVLEGCNYRRAGGKFFRRVALTNDVMANAYEEVCDIKTFVQQHTAYSTSFKEWLWITNPSSNMNAVVEYMTVQPLAEAPDLEEVAHLRSYAGDDEGNGAGVYNHAQDMFYPYERIEDWNEMAHEIQEIRRKLFNDTYECTAPSPSDVAVVHLPCSFPFDIYTEVRSIDPSQLFCKWVEVDAFECRHGNRFPEAQLQNANFAGHLLREADRQYDLAGKSKESKPRPRILIDARMAITELSLDPNEITARTFVCWENRYFRVDTGFKWFDIETPELDQIYKCQEFTDHDCYMLYATSGRIFFKVGERDNFEGTIMREGIGGCGKSTEVKIYQQFWPPHRRGNLSANIQTQFGMAVVARGDVAWCTELSDEPNMPQEDWQDATGGHTVVCPVKHQQEPLIIHNWHAQFWWCSNVFPKKYNNKQGQVTRRLYGVAMFKPVQPRRDDIMSNVRCKLGYVQRRSILAYEDWLLQQGNIDPNSQVHDLPPAFRNYAQLKKRETDPIMEFLTDKDYIDVDAAKTMPMSKFRELYNEWRQYYDMGKASRWCEDVYRNAFSEWNIFVQKRQAQYDWNGETLHSVDVIYGIGVSEKQMSPVQM